MAAEPTKRYTFGDLAEDTRRVAVAGFSLLVFGVLALVFSDIIFVLAAIFWPSVKYTVDQNVIKLANVIAWPVTVIIAIFFLSASKTLQQGSKSIFSRVSKLKAGGYEVNFSQEGAKKLKKDFEGSLADFADQSKIEYTRSARTHMVREALRAVLDEIHRVSKNITMPTSQGIKDRDIKATVHILDVLYEDSLYQLVDYLPTGGGSGRRFSTRFGAIGIALRLGSSQFWNSRDPDKAFDRLITHYGMNKEEAAHAGDIEYVLAIPLLDSKGNRPGIFFLKSDKISSITNVILPSDDDPTYHKQLKSQNASLQNLKSSIENDSLFQRKFLALSDAVSNVFSDIAPSGTFIRVYA